MSQQGRPFLFCRYLMEVDGESLDPKGQFQLLQELQGQLAPHGRRAIQESHLDTLVMRPRRGRLDGTTVLTWSIGQVIDIRVKAVYDEDDDDLVLQHLPDGGVRYSDFVAIPSLGVMAVDDRSGEIHLGGRAAIRRFQSVMRTKDDAELNVTYDATPAEVRKALRDWGLTKFKFTIRPNNPRPVSRLAQELSDLMKKEGIGQLTGTAKPQPGDHMKRRGSGYITAASDLVEAGYGQMSVAGITEDGLEAEIKKPRFDPDLQKNERIQAKPRELRVYVDAEMDEAEIFSTAAKALVKFYSD